MGVTWIWINNGKIQIRGLDNERMVGKRVYKRVYKSGEGDIENALQLTPAVSSSPGMPVVPCSNNGL